MKLFRDILPPDELYQMKIQRGQRPSAMPRSEGALNLRATERGASLSNKTIVAGDAVTKSIRPSRRIFVLDAWHRDSKTVRNIAIFALAAFAIVVVLMGLTISNKGIQIEERLKQDLKQGFSQLVDGGIALQSNDLAASTAFFDTARATFSEAQAHAWFVTPGIIDTVIADTEFSTAQAIIQAGTALADAGISWTTIAQRLSELPKEFLASQNRYYGSGKPSLTQQVVQLQTDIAAATDLFTKAGTELGRVPEEFIPPQFKNEFAFAQDALQTLVNSIGALQRDIPALLTLLGHDAPHTFLILLQNNAELRPTGGFIGNFLIAETSDGYLAKNEIFDVYVADHQLNEIVTPPPEIQKINDRWYLRDSNYSGDFSLSAKKAAWFLEKENGPGVDTVFAIDKTLIEELLTMTGPITIPSVRVPITADNFTPLMSLLIESKQFGTSDPKVVLREFFPAFQRTLFESADPLALVSMLKKAISTRHVLGFSMDEDVQQFFQNRRLAGELKNNTTDFLAVVHTSIGGNKSDDVISEHIVHDSFLNRDGSLISELSITRTHTWSAAHEEKIRALAEKLGITEISDHLLAILGKSSNLHMLRIYVPKGATLLTSDIPELTQYIDTETNLTYFSVPFEVPYQGSGNVRIRYQLPGKLKRSPVMQYSLTVIKQAGQEGVTLTKRIFPQPGMQDLSAVPEATSRDADGTWIYESALKENLEISTLWGV